MAISTSSGVMVSKLDEQTFMSEFESHWVPHSYGLMQHLSKKLSKLLLMAMVALGGVMVSKWDKQIFTCDFESH